MPPCTSTFPLIQETEPEADDQAARTRTKFVAPKAKRRPKTETIDVDQWDAQRRTRPCDDPNATKEPGADAAGDDDRGKQAGHDDLAEARQD